MFVHGLNLLVVAGVCAATLVSGTGAACAQDLRTSVPGLVLVRDDADSCAEWKADVQEVKKEQKDARAAASNSKSTQAERNRSRMKYNDASRKLVQLQQSRPDGCE
ncbi:hypothetical protein [Nocardia sp. NPDC057030]|uniref:hypothetical protein n=1 Tax=unclassified Nocardia TaxID=2637762 RepID=UPI003628F3FD